MKRKHHQVQVVTLEMGMVGAQILLDDATLSLSGQAGKQQAGIKPE